MTAAGHGGGAAETADTLLLSLACGAGDGLAEKRAAVSGQQGRDRRWMMNWVWWVIGVVLGSMVADLLMGSGGGDELFWVGFGCGVAPQPWSDGGGAMVWI
ncbi:hypothetical protein Drorol1_Dr00020123 [Drosera rotundifolia]